MNKLNKIFLGIIIMLGIALGIMTYYYFYMRNAYTESVNDTIKILDSIHNAGANIELLGDNTFKLVLNTNS